MSSGEVNQGLHALFRRPRATIRQWRAGTCYGWRLPGAGLSPTKQKGLAPRPFALMLQRLMGNALPDAPAGGVPRLRASEASRSADVLHLSVTNSKTAYPRARRSTCRSAEDTRRRWHCGWLASARDAAHGWLQSSHPCWAGHRSKAAATSCGAQRRAQNPYCDQVRGVAANRASAASAQRVSDSQWRRKLKQCQPVMRTRRRRRPPEYSPGLRRCLAACVRPPPSSARS